jgi:uncharacterized protein (TIGR03089 family)
MSAAQVHPLPGLLAGLEALGPRPALVSYAEEGRVELSGHVLANWITKATNHLADEIAPDPDDRVVLALPPHWKRLVLAVAGWALGTEVVVGPDQEDLARLAADGTEVRVLATEQVTGIPGGLADSADELLLLHPRSLSLRFEGELPALAHDWVAEVRAHADHLDAALGPWSGPSPASGDAQEGAAVIGVSGDGLEQAPTTLAALTRGDRVVLRGVPLTAEQARAEGL